MSEVARQAFVLLIMKYQGSYRQVWVKFKDFSRTFKSLSNSFQGLKVNEKYWSKCLNYTSEMLMETLVLEN